MTEHTPSLTQDEARFIARMMPHLITGLSFEDAAQAVIRRDIELMTLALSDTDEGAEIRLALAEDIYHTIRSQHQARA